jgi:hypothetical protein
VRVRGVEPVLHVLDRAEEERPVDAQDLELRARGRVLVRRAGNVAPGPAWAARA